jgi:gamma-glutamylcyclotransferase (GGCT)/AIG2-like uncharacterized protein YtfP
VLVNGYVFGYGSLVAEGEGCRVAVLHGYRRVWGVAMDNAVDLPGYKYYRLRSDGSRPAVYVAFVDVVADPAWSVTGVCIPVDSARLAELDARERNYVRAEVTSSVRGARGKVWAYLGSEDGVTRFRSGVAAGCVVVSRDYYDAVLAAVGAIAPDEVDALREAPPVLDLDRIELP